MRTAMIEITTCGVGWGWVVVPTQTRDDFCGAAGWTAGVSVVVADMNSRDSNDSMNMMAPCWMMKSLGCRQRATIALNRVVFEQTLVSAPCGRGIRWEATPSSF